MGKGDLRTRRGKIFRGTYGKTRPRKKRRKDVTKEQTSATSEQSKETPANETQVAKA
ncbi:MAG: 30S ribosomal protein THX [Pyrinomonas sp.]